MLTLFTSAAPSYAATDYPSRSRPVTIVVPYAAGGPGDVLSRAVADVLSKEMNGIFIIENKPGASQIIGARNVAKADPDGYTLLLGSTTSLAINPSLKKNLPYDPVKDFEPIALVINSPQYLITRPSFPANSLREFIDLAKKSPDKFTYASVGIGSTPHLAGELLNVLAGLSMRHVPYAGAAPVLNDVIAGHVDLTFTTTVLGSIRAGQVKTLGVTSAEPAQAAPDIPTIASYGMPTFDMGIWMGFLAPAGTPKEIITKLNEGIVAGVKSGALKERMGGAGSEYDPLETSPAEFRAFIDREIPKWQKIIDLVGIQKE
ncbi:MULTISPECIES: tripartite tricarboxylate transporter substrate binding protein [unclassified Beijerinckia]|uniref:Bug family tripartite tricarboxylate transporter substrate binding protein n=1 Tax=unclassified Beijerinckia TaxID=2638183 RepID=UPI00147F5B01|nr:MULTISPECIES: tripartite tricarboxylate transporter substrate binding protein [unclassified Beijerinckia]